MTDSLAPQTEGIRKGARLFIRLIVFAVVMAATFFLVAALGRYLHDNFAYSTGMPTFRYRPITYWGNWCYISGVVSFLVGLGALWLTRRRKPPA